MAGCPQPLNGEIRFSSRMWNRVLHRYHGRNGGTKGPSDGGRDRPGAGNPSPSKPGALPERRTRRGGWRLGGHRRQRRRRETPGETGPGKDLGNFTGFAHSRITAHFHAALAGYSTATYDPIAAFLPNR